METEEITKLVDDIYKNILDKFNPGARQLIHAGKTYLKALHGATAASKVYVDALSRIARQAQLGTWGGSQDIGSALMRIVEVYKEIQEQEINILKAFYVDLLVPLETNLEKDTKVIQSEQKKFLQQHKMRSETYSKAVATMKKQRKKSRGASKSGLAMDKELKCMQILEEEKSKLDAFCEKSLKNAMTQERRRYGFVLERQCSLAKHYASFHEVSLAALHPSVEEWRDVSATREYLPQSVEDMFASRLRQVSFWPEDEENGGSDLTLTSQLRKTRSMDSSCLELRLNTSQNNHHNNTSANLAKARSEANIHSSTLSLDPEVPVTPPRPRSMAPMSRNSGISNDGKWGESRIYRAVFAYVTSGENQLSFHEGDLIALMGEKQKGWQFGENLRTQASGWFPLAYTESTAEDMLGSSGNGTGSNGRFADKSVPPDKPAPSRPTMSVSNGDDQDLHGSNDDNHGMPVAHNGTSQPGNLSKNNSSHSINTASSRQTKPSRSSGTHSMTMGNGRRVQPPIPPVPPPQAMTSLHSSNDSGFSNEPPVQPDVDYSDDEAKRQRRRKAQQQQQQPPQKAPTKEDKSTSPSNSRDWENDSWKTLPRDEKSWHIYRAAMTEYWSEVSSKKKPRAYQETEDDEDETSYTPSLDYRYRTNKPRLDSSESASSESESEDEAKPEPGKVEQIAQKLEQTAQKYAKAAKLDQDTQTSPPTRDKAVSTLPTAYYRPRPPSTEAPERPSPRQEPRRRAQPEEVYGEGRGYESNFETKLERSKVLERVGRRNDPNNNSVKRPERDCSVASFDLASFGDPGPKLVKRTKSFWRFRRDSEVLEGMALWQHRSLVDIPKQLSGVQSRGSSSERQNSDSTITNEPKAADRLRAERPTPAERAYISRKAIIEKERRRRYKDPDDGLVVQRYTETEASDEESTYSCIVVKDQALKENSLLPRTKLRREPKDTCGAWYDLWPPEQPHQPKKKKKKQPQ